MRQAPAEAAERERRAARLDRREIADEELEVEADEESEVELLPLSSPEPLFAFLPPPLP